MGMQVREGRERDPWSYFVGNAFRTLDAISEAGITCWQHGLYLMMLRQMLGLGWKLLGSCVPFTPTDNVDLRAYHLVFRFIGSVSSEGYFLETPDALLFNPSVSWSLTV